MKRSLDKKYIRDCKKLAKMTRSVCELCPSFENFDHEFNKKNCGTRCCSLDACNMAEENLNYLEVKIQKTNHPAIPYMGVQGCIVPPYYRPLCTIFACTRSLSESIHKNEIDQLIKEVITANDFLKLVQKNNYKKGTRITRFEMSNQKIEIEVCDKQGKNQAIWALDPKTLGH